MKRIPLLFFCLLCCAVATAQSQSLAAALEALNHLRRPVLQTLTMEDEAVSSAAEAEKQTLFQQPDDERTELLERAIDHQTAEEQTLITLFYYDDLPLADIGYITGQAPGTVATRLHRIRHKLYQLIKEIQDL